MQIQRAVVLSNLGSELYYTLLVVIVAMRSYQFHTSNSNEAHMKFIIVLLNTLFVPSEC